VARPNRLGCRARATALGNRCNAPALILRTYAKGLTVKSHGLSPIPYIVGPNGTVLTKADLPSRSTRRWVRRRKAEVVAAVRDGLISLEDACERCALTIEEFSLWQRAVDSAVANPIRQRDSSQSVRA
jgi:uncharacterized protein DUF1153